MDRNKIIISAVFETKDGVYYLNPKEGLEYSFDCVYHGEYDDDWIVVKKNGKEIQRHSLKFCVNYELSEVSNG
jgi:hypothetical protein